MPINNLIEVIGYFKMSICAKYLIKNKIIKILYINTFFKGYFLKNAKFYCFHTILIVIFIFVMLYILKRSILAYSNSFKK